MNLSRNIFILLCCGALGFAASGQSVGRKLILRDEGLSQLSYVDLSAPEKNWIVPIPPGRDLQLTGRGRVLIGTGTGYEEREISTGKKVNELTAFTGTLSAHRLRNGNTLLAGLNWQGKDGMVLAEIDEGGNTKKLLHFPQFNYVRLVRETQTGNFLITADSVVFESDATGKILWRAIIKCKRQPHSWQALRISNGETIVSSGFAANFQIFDTAGKPVRSITAPEEVHPYFFAGFQILKNGNLVVANWQGHGAGFGASGIQLLEFSPEGKMVWSWKQDAAQYSSLQGVIVLDNLNTDLLHVEGVNGGLIPVKGK
ncbi:MAG TPA: hypothetical protein PLR06_03370 [Cyclobacteriaceae bacterium]|nr:hypothetical protein [Cyclobacteriaceae bacterium]